MILNLFRQQGFGVLSVGLATQALHLLVSLLEDLQFEVALLPSSVEGSNIESVGVALSIHGRYTAWQRVQKLLACTSLTNLLFNLAAMSYGKVCIW